EGPGARQGTDRTPPAELLPPLPQTAERGARYPTDRDRLRLPQHAAQVPAGPDGRGTPPPALLPEQPGRPERATEKSGRPRDLPPGVAPGARPVVPGRVRG